MNFYYENHLGEKLYFFRSPYILTDHDFLDWALSFSVINDKAYGFRFKPVEKTFTIRIMPKAKTAEFRKAAFAELIDKFVSVTSADMKTSGKLWTDTGEYLVCRIYQTEKNEWNIPRDVTLTCKMRVDYPVWQKSNINEIVFSDDTKYEFLDYTYGYNYDYAGILPGYTKITNKSTEDADFIIRIPGAVIDPVITINNIKIGANVSIGQAQTLEINSRDRTVYIISGNIRENHFNDRYKNSDSMFTKLPPGELIIAWSGTFDFNLEILEGRREPAWR